MRSVLQFSMKQTAAAVDFAIAEGYGLRIDTLRFEVRLRIIRVGRNARIVEEYVVNSYERPLGHS